MDEHDQSKLDSAKRLFLGYEGSYFHMEREGVLGKYRRFRVSKGQEDQWMEEYERDLLSIVRAERVASDRFINLTNALQRTNHLAHARAVLEHVTAIQGSLDTLSLVIMCEGIAAIASSMIARGRSRRPEQLPWILDAKSAVLDMLSRSASMPVTVAPYYRDQGFLDEWLTEAWINERRTRLLKRCEDIRCSQG